MNQLSSRVHILSALCLLWLTAACADPAVVGGDMPPAGGVTVPPVGGPPTPGTNPNPPAGTAALRAVTMNPLLVNTGDTAMVKVQYIAGQSPVPNARVSFRLKDMQGNPAPAGVMGTNLSATNVNTDTAGIATINLIAGQSSTTMKLEAYIEATPTVTTTWDVTVITAGQGGLTFRVRYNPQMGRYAYNNFAAASVSLYNNVTCENLWANAPNLNGAYLALNDINPFNDITNTVTSPGVDAGLNLTAAAVIKGPTGLPLTFGCTPNVRVTDGAAQEFDIETTDLPLAFKGIYTTINRFDMIQALQDSDGGLSTVGDVFSLLRTLGGTDQEVGGEVILQLCGILNVDDSICRLVRSFGAGVVGSAINNNLDPQVRTILRTIGESLDIIGDLTIVGEMEFRNNPDPMGRLSPNDNRWQSMRFNWTQNCATPPNCERSVTFGQLGSRSRSVAGVFDAQLEGDGSVSILEHPFTVGYGEIMLGLIETWIIPLVLNPAAAGSEVGLEELLETLIPCDAIEEAVGIDDPADSTICEDILVVALSGLIRDQVSRLNFDGDALLMSGDFKPTMLQGSLNVDQLTEGRWRGLINNDVEFDGCFVGCRNQADCLNSTCTISP